MLRFPKVVRIQKGDEIRAGGRDAKVARDTCAAVRCLDYAHSRAVSARDFDRAIRGSVVDDDDLVRRVNLAEHAIKRAADEVFAIVGRYDSRDGPPLVA